MVSAQEGRPWCSKAKSWILRKDQSNTALHKQCRRCSEIVYVGCPGFSAPLGGDVEVIKYIKWARGDET